MDVDLVKIEIIFWLLIFAICLIVMDYRRPR
jgi:hypothetical protein